MKRKPSQELVTVIGRDHPKRMKSPPQQKKNYPRKQPEFQSIVLQKHKHLKSKEDVKGDSNNTTATIKSKTVKSTKKIKDKSSLGGQDIMGLINSFAVKIQRQWRVHAFRKKVKSYLRDLKSGKSCNKKSQIYELKFDNQKIRRFIQFQEEEEEEEIQSGTYLYDKSKYQNILSSKSLKEMKPQKIKIEASGKNGKSKTKKLTSNSKSSNSTPRNRIQKSSSTSKTPRQTPNINKQFSRSLERPKSSQDSKDLLKNKEERRASFNTFETNRFIENRRHSTGQLQVPPRQYSEKHLQIDKAYEIRIIQTEKVGKKEDGISKKGESEANIAFHKGSSFEKVMHKCKKQLQMNKLRKLLSVENRYSKNEVTYRSYLEIIGKINQEHTHKLQYIKAKEGELKNTLGQLIQLYKSNHHEGRFAQDDNQNSQSHLDVSLSFDKWDFNSSAKKSIDHLDFPQNNGSKILSIESVLRQLDEEETPVSEEKRFRKNKSLQVIEAIAERSKEISQKSVSSFQQVPQNSLENSSTNKTYGERDEIAQKNKKQDEKPIEQEKVVVQSIQNNSIGQIECEKSDKKVQNNEKQETKNEKQERKNEKQERKNEKQERKNGKQEMQEQLQKNRSEQIRDSQSLLISPGGPAQLVSEQQVEQSRQMELMNDLIFKDLKTQLVNYEDPLVMKLRELVIESMVMVNIKITSSLKFAFARAAEERKKKKVDSLKKIPPFQPDINSINSWLLQISHFMLDSYQRVLRQNLITVKQPPITEILTMAKKQINTLPLYQTIPEYIFKDFQFFYIKSLAKSFGVNDHQYDQFSALVYTFHRSLIDSLNTALMEELESGRQWIQTPWKTIRKFKMLRIVPQHAKLCLERSINVVSNWAEYGLGRLDYEDDFSEAEYRQFQEEKINLVCRQEVLEAKLNPTFTMGHILLKLTEHQLDYELTLIVQELQLLC